jgi:hypothetical protein
MGSRGVATRSGRARVLTREDGKGGDAAAVQRQPHRPGDGTMEGCLEALEQGEGSIGGSYFLVVRRPLALDAHERGVHTILTAPGPRLHQGKGLMAWCPLLGQILAAENCQVTPQVCLPLVKPHMLWACRRLVLVGKAVPSHCERVLALIRDRERRPHREA